MPADETLTPFPDPDPETSTTGATPTAQPISVDHRVLSVEEMMLILHLTETTGCNPRPLNRRHANNLAADMSAGRWGATAETLSLCPCGAVTNGRHRLTAAVRAGLPLEAFVARNVPHEQFAVIDAHRARTNADLIGIAGIESNRVMLSSAIRLVGLYDHRRELPVAAMRSSLHVPRLEMAEWFTQYVSMQDLVPLAGRTYRTEYMRFLQSAVLASAYLLYREVDDHDHVEQFFSLLGSGTGLSRNCPIDQARALLKVGGKGHRTRGHDQLYIFLKAWNLWATGRACTGKRGGKLTPDPGDPMPEIPQVDVDAFRARRTEERRNRERTA